MPQAKGVLSLFDLCLKCISENIDELSQKVSTITNDIDSGPSGGLFNDLPSLILQRIINAIEKNEHCQLNVNHYEMLITQHLIHLKLSHLQLQKNNMIHLLSLASIRCPGLKCLELSSESYHVYGYFSSSHFSENFDEYFHFIPKFEKLQVLCLASSSAGDSCLGVVGAFCPNLRELNVSWCPAVSDIGIESLCVSFDDMGVENAIAHCKLLQKLHIKSTQITKRGIQMALKKLPALKICSDVSVQLLSEIHQADDLVNLKLLLPQYSLAEFFVSNSTPYTRGSLQLAVFLCPLITKVEISEPQGFTDMDLLSLTTLKYLLNLCIYGKRISQSHITFDDGIAPVLKAVGGSLQHLHLSKINSINIQRIAELCPNLRVLNLVENTNYSSPNEKYQLFGSKRLKLKQPIFQELERLQFVCHQYVGQLATPSEIFMFLLSSPSLMYIDIQFCETLTDELLEHVTKYHDFVHLEFLKLACCGKVSARGIDCFMRDNPLKVIELLYCKLFSETVIGDLERKAIERNWELSVVYEEYEPEPEEFDFESDNDSE